MKISNIILTFLIHMSVVSSTVNKILPDYDIVITGSYEQDGIFYIGEKIKFVCFLKSANRRNDSDLFWDVSNMDFETISTPYSIESLFYVDNITLKFEKDYKCSITDGSRKVLITQSLRLKDPPKKFLDIRPISKLNQIIREDENIEIKAIASGFPTPIKKYWIWTPFLPISTDNNYTDMNLAYITQSYNIKLYNNNYRTNNIHDGNKYELHGKNNYNNDELDDNYNYTTEQYDNIHNGQQTQHGMWNITYSNNNRSGVIETRKIFRSNLINSGNYTFIAENQYAKKNKTFQIYIHGLQVFSLSETYIKWGEMGQISCRAYSYPKINKFEWSIIPCTWTIKPRFRCIDKNKEYFKLSFSSKPKSVGLLHYSTLLNFTNTNSLIALKNFSFGFIECLGFNKFYNKSVGALLYIGEQMEPKTIFSSDKDINEIIKSNKTSKISFKPGEKFNVTCEGLKSKYRESIEWCKKFNKTSSKCLDINLKDLNTKILKTTTNTTYQATLMFLQLQTTNNGLYQCIFRTILDDKMEVISAFEINLKYELHPWLHHLTSGIIIILLILVAILMFFYYKYFQMRKKLKELGLANFSSGKPDSINPEIAISEQAELLPYNKNYEISKKKLQLGKLLGQGAFGCVYMASVNSYNKNKVLCCKIKEIERPKIVAVKMIKHETDPKTLQALSRELKILQYIGKHPYIINLHGAITKAMHKCELMLIIEYCKYGSLDTFLLKNRNGFADQINKETQQINLKIINRSILNITDNNASKESGDRYNEKLLTDFNESDKKRISENLYITTIRRKQEKSIEFNTTDLLMWSRQIACGMNHLASMKIVHGDLAARNILLSDRFTIKISDFGLAKQIYENEHYKKLSHKQLLPIKWYSIEAIEDRKLTTKSDVWSYGVVLWEIFSLGKTPYSDIEHIDFSFFDKLKKGYRLEQPRYGNRTIYNIMLSCWKSQPFQRPSFDDLLNLFKKYQEEQIVLNYNNLTLYDNFAYVQSIQSVEDPINFLNNAVEIHPIYEEINEIALTETNNIGQIHNTPNMLDKFKLNNALSSSSEYQNLDGFNSQKTNNTNINSTNNYENLKPNYTNVSLIKDPMKENLVNELNIILENKKSLEKVKISQEYQNI